MAGELLPRAFSPPVSAGPGGGAARPVQRRQPDPPGRQPHACEPDFG